MLTTFENMGHPFENVDNTSDANLAQLTREVKRVLLGAAKGLH